MIEDRRSGKGEEMTDSKRHYPYGIYGIAWDEAWLQRRRDEAAAKIERERRKAAEMIDQNDHTHAKQRRTKDEVVE